MFFAVIEQVSNGKTASEFSQLFLLLNSEVNSIFMGDINLSVALIDQIFEDHAVDEAAFFKQDFIETIFKSVE